MAAEGGRSGHRSRDQGRAPVAYDSSPDNGPAPRALDPIIDLGAGSLEPGLEARIVPHLVVDAGGDHLEVLAYWRDGERPLEPRARLLRVSSPTVVLRNPPRGEDLAEDGVTGCSRRDRGAQRVGDLRRLPNPPQGVQAHGPHPHVGAQTQRSAAGGV